MSYTRKEIIDGKGYTGISTDIFYTKSEVQELKDKIIEWQGKSLGLDMTIQRHKEENEKLQKENKHFNETHLNAIKEIQSQRLEIEKLQKEKKILYEDLLESNKKAETSHKNSLDRLDKIIKLEKENETLKRKLYPITYITKCIGNPIKKED